MSLLIMYRIFIKKGIILEIVVFPRCSLRNWGTCIRIYIHFLKFRSYSPYILLKIVEGKNLISHLKKLSLLINDEKPRWMKIHF